MEIQEDSNFFLGFRTATIQEHHHNHANIRELPYPAVVAQVVLNLNRARSLLPAETECRCQSLYQYSGSKYLYIRKRPITGRHRSPMDTTLDCSSTDPRFEPASSQDFFISILASLSIIVILFYVFHISVHGNNTL